MKHTHPQAIVQISSRVFISLITILTIVLSLLQPTIAVQAAAIHTRNIGLDTNNVSLDKSLVGTWKPNTSISLMPTGPTAPDWPPIFTKKFSPNPIYVGEISTLTFTIVNEVWMALTGSAFTDPLPPGVQVAANPAASTTCLDAIFNPTPGATVLSFFGTLPGRGSCTIQVNVTSSEAGSYFNITSELTTETGLIGAPATDTLVVLPRHPSLKLTKEVSTSTSGPWTSYLEVPAETNVYYRLTVENTGDVDLTNVQVNDPKVDLTGCSLSTPFTLTTANPTASCITGAVIAHAGIFTNTATAQGVFQGKTYTATSTAEVLGTAVALTADLSVTKSNGSVCVYIDRSTTYTITVTNNGPDTVIGARFVDTPGTGLIATGVVCAPTPGNQCSTTPILADLTSTNGIALPSLSTGQFYQIKMTATTDTDVTKVSDTVMNTATVTMPTGITDPTPDNNTAVDNDIVLPPPSADLVVTKTDGVTYLRPNDTTTYIIRILNRGPDPVSGAMFIDTVGAGLNVTGVICSPVPGNECFTPPNPTNLFSNGISLPNLTPGQFYEIRLTAKVTVSSGLVTNIATVTMPIGTPDPTPSNNTATDTDTVTTTPPPATDLAVTKTDGVEVVNTNSSTTYTIRVTNNGPDAVTGATLVDSVGTGLNDPAVICSSALGNQCVTSPLIATLTSTGISLPALTPGQFYEIKLTATVVTVSGPVTNTATVTLPTGTTDPTPSNNTTTDTDTVATTPALYHVYLPFANSPTLESTSTWDVVVGYEDLPLVTGENDFDYNDWSVAIDGSLTFTSASSNLLHTFTLSFIPLSRGGIYDHTFQVRITAQTFNSNGSVEVNLYDKNHNLISKQVTPFYSSTDNTYVIFAKTSEVFPGSVINTVEGVPTASAQRYADFTITFDNPTPFIFTPDYLNQPHGGGLFFDPTMLVLNNGEQIHRGDVRLLSIPSSAYLWPEESIRIDRAYPLVVFKPGNPSDFSFPPSWWTVHNHCVYDGFTCGTP